MTLSLPARLRVPLSPCFVSLRWFTSFLICVLPALFILLLNILIQALPDQVNTDTALALKRCKTFNVYGQVCAPRDDVTCPFPAADPGGGRRRAQTVALCVAGGQQRSAMHHHRLRPSVRGHRARDAGAGKVRECRASVLCLAARHPHSTLPTSRCRKNDLTYGVDVVGFSSSFDMAGFIYDHIGIQSVWAGEPRLFSPLHDIVC